MCGGGGGGGGTDAAELERQRQGRIEQGMKKVDSTFNQFDNGYYDNIRGAYLDYVLPDFNQQYDDAQRSLAMALARQGVLSSSMAADKTADLEDTYSKNMLQVQQDADGYVNDRRAAVESARNAVVNQLNASANASQAGQQAINQATALQALPKFSTLGNLFGTATDGLRYQMAAEQNGNARYNTGLFGLPSGSNSSKVVN